MPHQQASKTPKGETTREGNLPTFGLYELPTATSLLLKWDFAVKLFEDRTSATMQWDIARGRKKEATDIFGIVSDAIFESERIIQNPQSPPYIFAMPSEHQIVAKVVASIDPCFEKLGAFCSTNMPKQWLEDARKIAQRVELWAEAQKKTEAKAARRLRKHE